MDFTKGVEWRISVTWSVCRDSDCDYLGYLRVCAILPAVAENVVSEEVWEREGGEGEREGGREGGAGEEDVEGKEDVEITLF